MSVFTDAILAFEQQMGVHRTHAAMEAVRRSDRSRIEVLAQSKSSTVIVSQPRFMNDQANWTDPLNVQIPFQLLGIPYGFDNIEVEHTGSTIVFTHKGHEYVAALPFADVPYTIISYIVEPGDNPQAQQINVQPGQNLFLYGNVRIINNLNEDFVEVGTISDPIQGPMVAKLNRDDEVNIFGMTYSDARRQLCDGRVALFEETFAQAKARVQEQTHVQIPTRFERNNKGHILPRPKDVAQTGNAPATPFELGTRLVHIRPNRINLPDISDVGTPNPESVYVRGKGYVGRFEDLKDNYDFSLGPLEVSTCERLYRRFLFNDANLLPETEQDIVRSVIEKQILAINTEPGLRDNYLNTLRAVKQIAFDKTITFNDAVSQLAIRRMTTAGSTDFETYQADIVNLLNRGRLQGVKARMEFTVAYGCLVTFGRIGVAQRFLNMVNGGRGTPTNSELSVPFNQIVTNETQTALFDPTTGYGLSGINFTVMPSGVQIMKRDPLNLLGYFKSYGEVDQKYMARPCVANFEWEVDLTQLIFENVDTSQADMLANFALVTKYLDNIAKIIQININIYSQFVLSTAWDNIALPLTPTRVERPRKARRLMWGDYYEQHVNPGILHDGKYYSLLRIAANSDRITFGVPTVDQLFDLENFKPKPGYNALPMPNVDRPFVIVEEYNQIEVPRANQQVTRSHEAGALLKKTVLQGESTVYRNHTGFMVSESDILEVIQNPLDRTVAQMSVTPYFPNGVSYSDMVEITGQAIANILAQLSTIQTVPGYTFFGTVLEDNGSTVVVKPDGRDDLTLSAENLDVGNVAVGSRVLVVEKSKAKYAALRLPITTNVANITTREIFEDRFAPVSDPEQFSQISADDVNETLLHAMLKTMETVNRLYIEPTMYSPAYAGVVQSITETNNTANNTVTVDAMSANGENLYRFSTASGTTQDISLVVQHPIPYGFDRFAPGANPLALKFNVTNGAGSNLVKVQVLDSNGASDLNVTLSQQTTYQEEVFGPLSGTYTPGGFMRIVITVFVVSGETVDVGLLRVRNS